MIVYTTPVRMAKSEKLFLIPLKCFVSDFHADTVALSLTELWLKNGWKPIYAHQEIQVREFHGPSRVALKVTQMAQMSIQFNTRQTQQLFSFPSSHPMWQPERKESGAPPSPRSVFSLHIIFLFSTTCLPWELNDGGWTNIVESKWMCILQDIACCGL